MESNKKTKILASITKTKLPARFQEVLAESEIQLEEGLSILVLKKLVYLYTMAMQHYNLERNTKLQQFYNKKLVSLLTRPDVTEYLNKSNVNINDNSDLNLFPEEAVAKAHKKKMCRANTITTSFSESSFNKQQALDIIKKKMEEADIYINNITKTISKDVLDQMMNYNEKIKNLKNPNNTSTSVSNEDSEESENDDEFFANIQKQKELEINNSNTTSNVKRASLKKRGSVVNSVVLDETEAYIKKSIEEENKEINEIKAEYEETIKDLPPDLASAYIEERDEEIRNLQAQYEDKRAKDLEKLKKKH